MAMAALPQELTEEILARLPVKSLLRFKAASKKWYSLISEDDKFHLKQSSISKNFILYQMELCRWSYIYGGVFQYSDIDTYESRKITFPIEIAESCHLIGSANRLICLTPDLEGRGGCFICNPCTGEYKNISLPCWSRKHGSGSIFGYDSISDDYKIIGGCGSRIRMFSLKTNSWKLLDCSVIRPWEVSASYSNGALHWCVTATRCIAAFDLAKEKVFFIELPKEMKLRDWIYTRYPLFDYQDKLCTCDGKSIWVMREYANAKSWAKFSTPLPVEYSVPIGISRLGEVVYRTSAGIGLVKFDTQGRTADEDKLLAYNPSHACVYKESLISPKCFDTK